VNVCVNGDGDDGDGREEERGEQAVRRGWQ
jgi:hypothetical protein